MVFSPPESRFTFCNRLPGGIAMISTPASRMSSASVSWRLAFPPPKSRGKFSENRLLTAFKGLPEAPPAGSVDAGDRFAQRLDRRFEIGLLFGEESEALGEFFVFLDRSEVDVAQRFGVHCEPARVRGFVPHADAWPVRRCGVVRAVRRPRPPRLRRRLGQPAPRCHPCLPRPVPNHRTQPVPARAAPSEPVQLPSVREPRRPGAAGAACSRVAPGPRSKPPRGPTGDRSSRRGWNLPSSWTSWALCS